MALDKDYYMVAADTMDMCEEELFDNIDDLLNFPCEDFEEDGTDPNGLKDMWELPQDNLSSSSCDGLLSGGNTSLNAELPTELLVPYEDVAHLEWLSNFVEESFSPGNIKLDQDLFKSNSSDSQKVNSNEYSLNSNSSNELKDNGNEHSFNSNSSSNSQDNGNEYLPFQIPSPISVLDSSNSSAEIKTMPINPEIVVPGRARSKRPRPAIYRHRTAFPLMPQTSMIDPTQPFLSSNYFPELENSALNIPRPSGKKRMKVKLTPPPSYSASNEDSGSDHSIPIRKCLHCGITKTPQWRLGPLGPKTLCNACGVRYKSGRLFPEYRPAASPTFVPALHSNSHKKVLEMRTKGDHHKEKYWSKGSSSLIAYEGRGGSFPY